MGRELKFYSIYKITSDSKYYVLRTVRPDFNNASQGQEDEAIQIEIDNRNEMLRYIKQRHNNENPEFIGELQDFPLGDVLYSDEGKKEVNIYYMDTEFGHPWIILGSAGSEEDFLSELNDDEETLALKPIGHPKQITAWYLTENDIIG